MLVCKLAKQSVRSFKQKKGGTRPPKDTQWVDAAAEHGGIRFSAL